MYDGRAYKIGKTNNLEKRVSSLKTGNPTIELLYFVRGDIENKTHIKYKESRLSGEWFNLTNSQLEDINNTFQKYLKCEKIIKPKKVKKDKHNHLMTYKISKIVDLINKSDTLVNKHMGERKSEQGVYKVEVMKDCNFYVKADNENQSIGFMRELNIKDYKTLVSSLVDESEIYEIGVDYCYQKDIFYRQYHLSIEDIIEELDNGIICDDFVSY